MSWSSTVSGLSPSHWWRLGGASSPLADSAGSVTLSVALSPVTLGVAGAISGDSDKAVSFDGTGGRLDPSSGVTLGATGSCAFWIFPVPTGDGYGTVLANAATTGIWYRGSLKKIDLYFTTDHLNTTPLTENAWNFVVISCNAGTVTFYLNGVADGTASGWPGNTNLINIGNDVSSEKLKARLDELMLFTTALSGSNVLALYNAGLGSGIVPSPYYNLLNNRSA
jgi:hypothetical protein